MSKWKEVQLEDVLESLETGSRPRGGVRGISEGIPSLGGEHLNYNRGFNTENVKYIPESFFDSMKKGIIQERDILVVKDGATTGKTSIVTQSFPYDIAAVNEHVFICRPNKLIDERYLHYFLYSKEGQERILNNFKGSAQGGINTGFIKNTLVPIAPLDEQKRIADKLDKAFEYIDKVKARMDAIPELLKEFRKMVLSQAVRDDDYFPKENTTVKEVIIGKPKNGFSPKGVNYETEVKSLTLSATTSGVFKGEHVKYLDIEKPNQDSPLWLKKGDILIQRSNTPDIVGISAIYTEEDDQFIYPDLMMKLKCNDKIIPEYLHFSLLANWYDGYFKDNATGTSSSMQKINQQIVLNTPINLPSIDDQNFIVTKTKELLLIADRVQLKFNQIKNKLDDLPNQLLAKAFKGELVEPNLNDEPAEKLLERVKEEMEKLKPNKRKRKKK